MFNEWEAIKGLMYAKKKDEKFFKCLLGFSQKNISVSKILPLNWEKFLSVL